MTVQPVTITDEYLAAILQELQAIKKLLETPPAAQDGVVELRETPETLAAPREEKPAHRDAARRARAARE